MKKRLEKKLYKRITKIPVQTILNDQRLLQRLAANPQHDEDLKTIITRDLAKGDAYRLGTIVRANSLTTLTEKESPTSIEWRALESIGEHRALAGRTMRV